MDDGGWRAAQAFDETAFEFEPPHKQRSTTTMLESNSLGKGLVGGTDRAACQVWGDPHVEGFVGNYFDIQDDGIYTVLASETGRWKEKVPSPGQPTLSLRPCPGQFSAPGRLQVQAEFYTCGPPNPRLNIPMSVRCVKQVVLRVGDNVLRGPTRRDGYGTVNGVTQKGGCATLPGGTGAKVCVVARKRGLGFGEHTMKYHSEGMEITLDFVNSFEGKFPSFKILVGLKNGDMGAGNYGICGDPGHKFPGVPAGVFPCDDCRSGAGGNGAICECKQFQGTCDLSVEDCNLCPSVSPTEAPTTEAPTLAPSGAPTDAPSAAPTLAPTEHPTTKPPTTNRPSLAPTQTPTEAPSHAPTHAPSNAPTHAPSAAPTLAPTLGSTPVPLAPSLPPAPSERDLLDNCTAKLAATPAGAVATRIGSHGGLELGMEVGRCCSLPLAKRRLAALWNVASVTSMVRRVAALGDGFRNSPRGVRPLGAGCWCWLSRVDGMGC